MKSSSCSKSLGFSISDLEFLHLRREFTACWIVFGLILSTVVEGAAADGFATAMRDEVRSRERELGFKDRARRRRRLC